MARMKVEGLADFSTMLQSLQGEGVPICKRAIYDGAAVLIEEVKRQIQEIPEQKGFMHGSNKRRYIAPWEKKDLLSHAGIAHINEKSGNVSTSIGFDGISKYKSKAHPSGIPVPILAYAVIRGGPNREYYDFLRRAFKAAAPRVQQVMQATAEAEIKKLNE